jgi:hypothetical protein
MVGTTVARLSRVLRVVAALGLAVAWSGTQVPRVEAQITNESPYPGSVPSGCDYDQRGNYYCWGGANNTAPVTKTFKTPPPFNGCYQWFNGVPVQIRIDHTVVAGPFTAQWAVVNSAERKYSITWPQASVSTVTVSADGKSLSGSNQYGGTDHATRTSGSSGLVGAWKWEDVVTSTVTVKADGTFTATSSDATWHGTWKAPGAARTYTLTASDLPKDQLTMSGDGMSLSGADQYGLKISASRTFCSPR